MKYSYKPISPLIRMNARVVPRLSPIVVPRSFHIQYSIEKYSQSIVGKNLAVPC